MLVKIALIVSLCQNVTLSEVKQQELALQKAHPNAVVSVRFDKKCKVDADIAAAKK